MSVIQKLLSQNHILSDTEFPVNGISFQETFPKALALASGKEPWVSPAMSDRDAKPSVQTTHYCNKQNQLTISAVSFEQQIQKEQLWLLSFRILNIWKAPVSKHLKTVTQLEVWKRSPVSDLLGRRRYSLPLACRGFPPTSDLFVVTDLQLQPCGFGQCPLKFPLRAWINYSSTS